MKVNAFIRELGFSPLMGKDYYIPESLFYLLGRKANNESAQEFQRWITVDVLQQIRKSRAYNKDGDNCYIDQKKQNTKISESSPKIRAIFYLDKRTVEIGNRLVKFENNMTIDYSQQEELRTLAVKKALLILGGKNTPTYRELNKKAFSIICVILRE